MPYVCRYRMEIDLRRTELPRLTLQPGYVLVPWQPELLERHAFVKYRSFCNEIDSQVFRCLGHLAGCRRLMNDIVNQGNFLPEATWLACYCPSNDRPPVDCGTIQGLGPQNGLGAIQNVGVVPEHRGKGVGRALLLKALQGFRSVGLDRVYLEVTASNEPAVRLYRSLGFELVRTLYKPLEVDTPQVY